MERTPFDMELKNAFLGFAALWTILILGLNVGCNRLEYSNDPSYALEFSSDTVLFDTVFTSIGSITLPLKVYNLNEQAVQIESIELMNGGGVTVSNQHRR